MRIEITIFHEDSEVSRNEMKEKGRDNYEYHTPRKFEGNRNDLEDLVKELNYVFHKKGLAEVNFYDIKGDLERLSVGEKGYVEIPEKEDRS